MTKATLRKQLEAATQLLTQTQAEPRIRKPLREVIETFLQDLEEARTLATQATTETLWRLGSVINPKTEQPVTLELRKDGGLVKGDRKRLGVEAATEWHEVRAASRTEAMALIEKGEGTHFQRKRGKVVEVAS